MSIDTWRMRLILAMVTRLFLMVLCALGLTFSPVTTSIGYATPATMPGCTMGEQMPPTSADHSKMGCCTPACQAPAPAVVLPQNGEATVQRSHHQIYASRQKALASLSGSGLDPPPRHLSS